jgi:uncharacterized protein (DUF1499 family)
MKLLAWLTRNWADTDEGGDAALVPFLLPLPVPTAAGLAEQVIRQLPRWRLESTDAATGRIHATRRTRLFRFVDDIHLRLEPVTSGTAIHARSQSRLGKGDFGQNRRNLLELFRALRAQTPPR